MKRIALAIQISLLLGCVCWAIGVRASGMAMPWDARNALIVLGMPALAVLVVVLLVASFPDVMPFQRLSFPLNVSLPLIYCGVLFAVVWFVTASGSSIQKPPESLRPALIWLDWRYLTGAFAVQVGLLSLALWISRRRMPTPPSPNR